MISSRLADAGEGEVPFDRGGLDVRLDRLRIEGLRCLQSVDLRPASDLNVLVGANGAGKTSVLEAIHCLSNGRSFRSGGQENLIGRGVNSFSVYGEVLDAAEQRRQLGFERLRSSWRGRLDGADVATLGEFARVLAVVCFEPQSHELVSGSGEGRRRLLDLGLFHVEQGYLLKWRRFQRALKQRNAALRERGYSRNAEIWEQPLAAAGDVLAGDRRAWCESLSPYIAQSLDLFLPEFGAARLRWRRGWPEDLSLADALAASRERDRDLGYTVRGPQRGDMRVEFSDGGGRYELSRGQQKLVALALLLATASAMRERSAVAPIIALDDLPSELDVEKQRLCLRWCSGLGSQVWITGTQLPAGLSEWSGSCERFHVEQGVLSALL